MRLVLVTSVALGVAVAPNIARVITPGNFIVFHVGYGSAAVASNSPFSQNNTTLKASSWR